MSAPNLKSLTTVTIASAYGYPTDSQSDLIPALSTGHALSVEAIYVTNKHATSSGAISVIHRHGGVSPPDDVYLAANRTISIKTQVNLLGGKPVYMTEGDSLVMVASAPSIFDVEAPYSDMS